MTCSRRWMICGALAVTAGLASGCGGSASTQPAASADADVAQPPAQPSANGDTVSPQALATARGYELLAEAYAPVSARVNDLIAAETLRQVAAEAGSSGRVERERSGIVRVETLRLEAVLRATRRQVADAAIAEDGHRRVQLLMLSAIDSRLRAVRRLREMLDAGAANPVRDREVDELATAWRLAWDQSLADARSAMNVIADRRAQLGVAPEREAAVR